jgi:hypothetical protein
VIDRAATGAAAGALVGLLLALGDSANALRLPQARRCPIFPASSAWNRRVDRLPVARSSDALVRSIGAGLALHADFGSGRWQGAPIGIPVTVVRRAQRRVRVRFDYATESDRGPYPIPRRVPIEGGDDRHAVIVDRDRCRLYELYRLRRRGGGWRAGSGAIWSLRSNRVRPPGWTSADAAGLPILPGLARYDEVARGRIDHALRVTVRRTRAAYVYPARHFASDSRDPDLPPMGLRLRLRADYPLRGFPRQARIVLVALERYGMLVADNGSSWYLTGSPDRRWRNADLRTLGRVRGSDFEVVDARSLRP